MGGDSIELQFRFGKSFFDFLCGLKAFVRLEHVIRWLGAGSAGLFGIIKKLAKLLAPCCAPSILVEAILGHNGAEELAVGLRKCNPNLRYREGRTRPQAGMTKF